MKRVTKLLVAAVVFVGLLEGGIRLLELDALGLPPNPRIDHFDPDPELGWRLKAQLDVSVPEWPAQVRTNARRMRGPDVPKLPPAEAEAEVRVLCLGESTTFGDRVKGEEAYCARLEGLLRPTPRATLRAMNAGVPGWSSVQSLTFLKRAADELKPDLVVWYHEANDYLPASVRLSARDIYAWNVTDRELYGDGGSATGWWLKTSATARAWKKLRMAGAWDDSRRAPLDSAFGDIGLAALPLTEFGLPERTKDIDRSVPPFVYVTRVSPDEREETLDELRRVCAERGIALLVVHPAYRDSERHGCVLTAFAAAHDLPSIEAYDVLHPGVRDRGAGDRGSGGQHDDLFADRMHPTAEGHRRLAAAIADLIDAKRLLPVRRRR